MQPDPTSPKPDPTSPNPNQSNVDSDAWSRRSFVLSGAAGVLAAGAGMSAFARPLTAQPVPGMQPAAEPRPAADRTGPNPSITPPAYPKPPFPTQHQEWPGLSGKMTPKPDHGEQSYKGSGRLAGRKALITGGDSGIGRAVAIAYAREGADVAINYLPAEESDAREVIELIRAEGRKAVAIPGDLKDEAFCLRLISETVSALGGLDILVNNAGRQQARARIEDITTESFDATFKTNVYAPFWLTRAAMQYLQPGASIINTASIQAYDSSAHLLDYAQTKACNVAFTRSLAKQLAPRNIRVNAVAPGPFWTPLQVTGGQLEGMIETFGKDTPLARPGQPAEIAATFVHLAAPESSYTTGMIFGVTGGISLA